MAHPLHHAESSARRFGGVPDDYQHVHDWFDSSKEHLGLFVQAVAGHQTILGFEDWLLKVSVEHVQHRQNRAAA